MAPDGPGQARRSDGRSSGAALSDHRGMGGYQRRQVAQRHSVVGRPSMGGQHLGQQEGHAARGALHIGQAGAARFPRSGPDVVFGRVTHGTTPGTTTHPSRPGPHAGISCRALPTGADTLERGSHPFWPRRSPVGRRARAITDAGHAVEPLRQLARAFRLIRNTGAASKVTPAVRSVTRSDWPWIMSSFLHATNARGNLDHSPIAPHATEATAQRGLCAKAPAFGVVGGDVRPTGSSQAEAFGLDREKPGRPSGQVILGDDIAPL